jgi:L-asparaginase II
MMHVDSILAEAYRGDFCENRHRGWLVVTDTTGHSLYSTPGAAENATFFRSSAKPFQVYPLVSAGYYRALCDEELAIACASHSGSDEHLAWVISLLEKAGLQEAHLQCGAHPPLEDAQRLSLEMRGQPPRALHNNCSGKHSGMLYACVRSGWPVETYLDLEHPLQLEILEGISRWSGETEVPRAIDGCGAPVFYMPLKAMARLYANLGVSEVFAPIVKAMTAFPVLVGGEGRIDTVLMQASGGKLLAKVGADGVMGVSLVGRGQGMAVKIADGSNELRNRFVVWALQTLGWLEGEALLHPGLSRYQPAERLNTQGRVVGQYRFYLPN